MKQREKLYFDLNISYFIEKIGGEYKITGASTGITKDGKDQNMIDYYKEFDEEELVKDWWERCKK